MDRIPAEEMQERKRRRRDRRILLVLGLVAGHLIIGFLVWDVQRGLARVQTDVRAQPDLPPGGFAIRFAGFATRPAIVYAFSVLRDGRPFAAAYFNPYSRRVEVVPIATPGRDQPARE